MSVMFGVYVAAYLSALRQSWRGDLHKKAPYISAQRFSIFEEVVYELNLFLVTVMAIVHNLIPNGDKVFEELLF